MFHAMPEELRRRVEEIRMRDPSVFTPLPDIPR